VYNYFCFQEILEQTLAKLVDEDDSEPKKPYASSGYKVYKCIFKKHKTVARLLAISELRKGLGLSENINLIKKQTLSHERSP
jgi:hypothetical protein